MGIIERSRGIMWTFMFHSGLSAFSSSDINKIVSILSNAASASKTYWNNNICIKCTHLPFTEITVFQIFSIQILKPYFWHNGAFPCDVWKWRTGQVKAAECKTFQLSEQQQNIAFTAEGFVKEPDTWCFYLQLVLHETRRIAPISPVSFCQER